MFANVLDAWDKEKETLRKLKELEDYRSTLIEWPMGGIKWISHESLNEEAIQAKGPDTNA
jgi:hypothetical protein